MLRRISAFGCLASLFVSAPLFAAWPSDPTINLPVVLRPPNVGLASCVSDGSGGLIAIFGQSQPGASVSVLRAQRVDAVGVRRWAPDGEAVSLAIGRKRAVYACSDGAGGAFVAWVDEIASQTSRVYAQHLDASGASRWITDGVLLSGSQNAAGNLFVLSDEEGGVVVGWSEGPIGGLTSLRAQRLRADGEPRWTPGGVIVADSLVQAGPFGADRDGTGGLILGSLKMYSASSIRPNVWRTDGSGASRWGRYGAIPGGFGHESPQVASDGRSGAILFSERGRGDSAEVVAQRVDSLGQILWSPMGVRLRVVDRSVRLRNCISDAKGGAILVWRTIANNVVECQRVDAVGGLPWGPTPRRLNPSSLLVAIGAPSPMPDGEGGMLIAFEAPLQNGGDVHAQRVSADGVLLWALDGLPVCSAPGYQPSPSLISDGTGGAIAAWTDNRPVAPGVYAQRIGPDGTLGGTPLAAVAPEGPRELGLRVVGPMPSRGPVSIECALPAGAPSTVMVFDALGRRLERFDLEASDRSRTERIVLRQDAAALPAGLYLVRVQQSDQQAAAKLVVVD